MKKFAIAAIFLLLIPAAVQAQTTVTVDADAINLGFMNVYNLPAPDGDGAFQFGQPWGFADLTAVYSGYDLTLGPNTIDDPNEYWYQCVGEAVPPDCGGPGAPGNKIMEANAYAEVTDELPGQVVTFTGEVISNTLTDAHTVVAFIKDYAGDYSSFIEQSVPLTTPGTFTVTLETINEPGRHVQWGFQMVGVNVWSTDVGPYGSITIGPDYSVGTEDSSWGAIKNMLK